MFDESQRNIFKFYDGTRERRADPIAVDWAFELALEAEDREALRNQADGEDAPAAIRASETMLKAIRKAFGVTEFNDADQTGLTIGETFELFTRYRDWCDDLKADGEDTPKSSPTPASPPASPTTTKPIAASTGTAGASRQSRPYR